MHLQKSERRQGSSATGGSLVAPLSAIPICHAGVKTSAFRRNLVPNPTGFTLFLSALYIVYFHSTDDYGRRIDSAISTLRSLPTAD